jgi:dTDP-glucose 4,6-dehydratase
MRVLVLGGSYFVGRHIALSFRARGHEVTLLNRGTRAIALPGIVADRNDEQALHAALAGQSFDIVVDTSCYDSRQALSAVSALGGRFRRWIFVSTAAVYDDSAPRPLHESARASGSRIWGEYGIKKAAAEAALSLALGSKLVVVRPGYVYGPHNILARETFLWSRLLRRRALFVPGMGATPASFVYAQDLADMVCELAHINEAAGRTYNVAHPTVVTLEQWVHAAAQAAQVEARIVHVPAGTLSVTARDFFPLRDHDLSLAVHRLELETGLVARTSLQAGLAATFAGYSPESLRTVARESSVDLELSLALGVA